MTFENIVRKDDLLKEHSDILRKDQLSWMLRERGKNGLQASGAVLKVGGRIYIDKVKFEEWFVSHAGA